MAELNADENNKRRIKQIARFREGIVGSTPEKPPSSRYLDWFHGQTSYRRPTDLHHQIGFNSWDASRGDHTHDGTDSSLILDGLTIEGERGTDAYDQSVNALLVRLGATNNSTAP